MEKRVAVAMPSCQVQYLKDKLAETQAEHLRAWHFGDLGGICGSCIRCKSLQIFVLCRASSTSIAFQVNSDSTRTFGQAQSSLSDAVAEQLRQEIGSLRAKAAQVPCQSI